MCNVAIGTAVIELTTRGRFLRSGTNFTDHHQFVFLQCKLPYFDQRPYQSTSCIIII
jgi:hypothetical protein